MSSKQQSLNETAHRICQSCSSKDVISAPNFTLRNYSRVQSLSPATANFTCVLFQLRLGTDSTNLTRDSVNPPSAKRFASFRTDRIAFPTTNDAVLLVLMELFDVSWVAAECYSNTWGAWQSSNATLDTNFPVRGMVTNGSPASELFFRAHVWQMILIK